MILDVAVHGMGKVPFSGEWKPRGVSARHNAVGLLIWYEGLIMVPREYDVRSELQFFKNFHPVLISSDKE